LLSRINISKGIDHSHFKLNEENNDMDKKTAKKAVNKAVGKNIVREEIASMLDAMIHNDFEKAADHCHNCTVLITRRMTLGEAEEVDDKDEDEDEDKDEDKESSEDGDEDDEDEENEESSDDDEDEDEDEDDDKSSDKDEEDKDVKEGWKGPTTKVGTLKFGKKMNKQGPSKAGRPKKVGVKK
jgi:hypothetical protein